MLRVQAQLIKQIELCTFSYFNTKPYADYDENPTLSRGGAQ